MRTPMRCPSGKHVRYSYWQFNSPGQRFGVQEVSSEGANDFCKCEHAEYGSIIAGPHEICVGQDMQGVDVYTGSVLLGPTYSKPWGVSTKGNKTRNIHWIIRYLSPKQSNHAEFLPVERVKGERLRTYLTLREGKVIGDIYNEIAPTE